VAKRPAKPVITFPERLRRIHEAGLLTETPKGYLRESDRLRADLDERVRIIEAFVQRQTTTNDPTFMLFFVMYDIEDNRVRRHLARYLIRQGCTRMQKSVFLGSASYKRYREIADTLEEVNSMYENGDSILILPVTKDNMAQLNVIGKNMNYQMVVAPPKILII
jgi:CRISPR-associated protein Cas2